MAQERELPTDIDFSEADVSDASKIPQLPADYFFRFLVTDPKPGSYASGHLCINMRLVPLRDPDDASSIASPSVRHSLCLPFRNPNHEGHTAPKTASLCHEFLSAVWPDKIPAMPRKVDGEWEYAGKTISAEEVDEARKEATGKLFDELKALWSDCSTLDREAVYARTFANGDYINLKKFSAELPEDGELYEWPAQPKAKKGKKK